LVVMGLIGDITAPGLVSSGGGLVLAS